MPNGRHDESGGRALPVGFARPPSRSSPQGDEHRSLPVDRPSVRLIGSPAASRLCRRPVSPLPRLRQACAAVRGRSERPAGASWPGDLVLDEEVNAAVVSGVMVNEPQRDRSRDGTPITVLLISFPAPDERTSSGSALCEVEIPDGIADRHRRQLRLGANVLVVGELMGAGGIWATFLTAKPPT